MSYYIYVHKRKDNGVVFYLGKGTKCRAFRKEKYRNKEWKQVVNEAGGFDVEFLYENLTNEEALAIELQLLNSPSSAWELINIRKTNKVKEIKLQDICNAFYYDQTSESGLRYKIQPKNSRKQVNDPAGYKDKLGYYSVQVNGVRLLVHRIIYLIINGDLPVDRVIDHIDGNPSNNRVENLRCVTQRENTENRRSSKTSKTGLKNIYRHVNKSGNIYYTVVWVEDSVQKSKNFSVLRLGEEKAKELALEFRNNLKEN